MRLFFSLWPPEPVARVLAEQARLLAQQCGGKATRQETVHLTLAFLGEVDDVLLPSVIQAARVVRAAPFRLTVDCLGYWRHNRLLWAGCSSPAPELLILVEALRSRLHAASIACDESLRFAPHLTLVRKVVDGRAAQDFPDIAPLSWPCCGFDLVASRLASAGADYTAVAGFSLEKIGEG